MPPAESSSGGAPTEGNCEQGYVCTTQGEGKVSCVCSKCEKGYHLKNGQCEQKGNNGVGNGLDPQPPGNPPVNDGPGTSPGNPGRKGGG
ncbi:hypothetical protein AKJ09_08059 [Labilithrix luteola]|uniref:Uncharacterized protein n=1 Tax=Labilithrix luteola TaxID=1391654 RepID=A0A0K1Q6D4_9BACT|nr:hypothetical protein AKJ09_08059 [Labilithrix luteola]